MPRRPGNLTDAELGFLAERHLGTLTPMRADGSPRVVAIAFTHDPAEELAGFEARYSPAPENPCPVAIEISVDRVLGSV